MSYLCKRNIVIDEETDTADDRMSNFTDSILNLELPDNVLSAFIVSASISDLSKASTCKYYECRSLVSDKDNSDSNDGF